MEQFTRNVDAGRRCLPLCGNAALKFSPTRDATVTASPLLRYVVRAAKQYIGVYGCVHMSGNNTCSEMTEVEIDTELLIEEVRIHPELWDVSCEDYKNKNKKTAAWIQVCSTLIADFETKEEAIKNALGKYEHLFTVVIRASQNNAKSR